MEQCPTIIIEDFALIAPAWVYQIRNCIGAALQIRLRSPCAVSLDKDIQTRKEIRGSLAHVCLPSVNLVYVTSKY